MTNPATQTVAAAGDRSFDSVEQEVFLNLWRTYDRLKALEDDLFGRVGLSAQQYNTLRLLRSIYPDGMPTLMLGSRLISRAPDMTRLLDRLEQRGLLVRERKSENRRVVEVQITENGLKLLDEIYEAVQECHRQQLGHLSKKALRELSDLLRQARQPHEDSMNPSVADS
ncbi:HTH-type transcriptional regulator MhqR [Pirellulimonas nuda]|uniref:HTH-type transcriptional regulator MhqR n=2 Tax=Pirellulimonas nuda TaxID=2528009 RepID=A0A518DB18_9BACT|nr:HTH-type transcriptional regulator MhqR [Pirellulimonas nuda]